MSKYKVTRGTVVREIDAANEREALRRFVQESESSNLIPTAELIADVGGDPPKKRYSVTWGEDTREVVAVHEDDAWSQFVGNNTDTELWRHPNLHKRIIKELGPAEESEKPARSTEATGVSPVAGMAADEAIDYISRMRSAERVQEIISFDQRVTVQGAAQKRLEEIGGS